MKYGGEVRSPAMSRLDVPLAVVAVGREKQVTVVAASLAYYSFNLLVPFVLFLFVGLSFLGRLDLLIEGATLFGLTTPARIEVVVRRITGNAAGRDRAIAIAVVVFGWSVLRLFRTVQAAFADVYGTRQHETLTGRLVDISLVFVTVAVAFALLATVSVALTFLVDDTRVLLGPLLLFVALVVVFFPMYYLFPAVSVTVREVLPGAVAAAAAWTVATLVFRVYTATTASARLYGVVGAVLLVLAWLYVGGLGLLLGAILNAVLGDHIEPDHEWIPGWFLPTLW